MKPTQTHPCFNKVAALLVAGTLVIGIVPSAAFAETASLSGDGDDNAFEEVASVAGVEGILENVEASLFRDDVSLESENIDEGVSGTCKWWIDANGKLTVTPQNGVSGELSSWSPNLYGGMPFAFNDKIKTVVIKSGVKAKTCGAMFAGCPNLASADLSGLDTSAVKNFHNMFGGDSALESIDISCLNTSNVVDMGLCFYGCKSLKSVNLGGIDTSKLYSMNNMFQGCTALTYLDLSSLNLSNVTNTSEIFRDCPSLSALRLPAGIGFSKSYLHEAKWTDENGNVYATTDDMLAANKARTSGAMTYTVQGSNQTPGTFPDIVKGSWYYDSVTRASGLGLISGYDNGAFGPLNTLTRAQAATILWRYYEPAAAKAYDSAKSTTKNGTGMGDVQSYEWYTGAANWAVSKGVINGFDNPDGTKSFSPDGTITREQLCVIVANASAKYAGSKVTGASRTKLNSMPDAAGVDAWAADSVAWGLNNGVISGKESGGRRLIDPIGQMTRAEMAAVLMNAIDGKLLGD